MSNDPELTRLRARMDDVNRRLCDVLHERARLCRRIAAHKRDRGLPAIDPEREAAMLAAACRERPAEGFDAEALATILRTVFAASRNLVAAPPD